MTREEMLVCYEMNSKKVLAEILYDTITKYENKKCKTCAYYQDEVCVNSDSPLCTEFVSADYGCILWSEECN